MRIGFAAMPRPVAVASVVGGALVCVSGVVTWRAAAPNPGPPQPQTTLLPVTTPDPTVTKPAKGVTGTVASVDGDPLEGVDVYLVPLFTGKEADELETRTDKDGEFSFDKVDVDPGSPYVAEASFDGTRFASAVLRAPSTRRSPVELTVAKTTKDDDDLAVSVESLALVGDARAVQVVHALSVSNRGSRAFVGELRLPLLRGAASIQEGAGLDRRLLEIDGDSIVSRTPLLPGSHNLTYTYVTPMAKDGIGYERRLDLTTRRYEVLTAGDITIRDTFGLEPDDDVQLGPRDSRRTYERRAATELAPGDEVAGRIMVDTGPDLVRVVAPAIAAVAVLALFAIPLLRRRRRTAAADPS